jgi:hypothetical protein
MRLPTDTLIAEEKLTGYLLKQRTEDDKSRFLAQAGYKPENANQLLTDIRSQLMPLEATQIEQTDYGPKYVIRGGLTGPNGIALLVVTIWMTDLTTGITKFITLYPDKK